MKVFKLGRKIEGISIPRNSKLRFTDDNASCNPKKVKNLISELLGNKICSCLD
jgi:hypothetical protein